MTLPSAGQIGVLQCRDIAQIAFISVFQVLVLHLWAEMQTGEGRIWETVSKYITSVSFQHKFTVKFLMIMYYPNMEYLLKTEIDIIIM